MSSSETKPASPAFEWKPEYDDLLERIADTDTVETPWSLLSEIIKHKIIRNTDAFVGETKGSDRSPPPFADEPSTKGGLRLHPFSPSDPRPDGKENAAPKAHLNENEAKVQIDIIFTQLAEFESAPFTIQRLCELCVNRRQHYTSVGKYLRAVEKALLVTSAWDTFPAAPRAASPASPAPFPAGSAFATPARSAPTTPLFSPIPFLHEDARRSASRSPPPLALAPAGAPLGDPPAPADSAGVEPRALGLVDEMDDPGPGHMSERPTALSSVTTVPDEAALPPVKMEEEEGEDVAGASAPAAKKSRPLFSSLKDRFVASTAEKKEEEECDKMELDEGDNRGDQTAE